MAKDAETTYKVINIIGGQPTFKAPLNDILSQLQIGGAIKIISPIEYHTDCQRKWYRGVCLKGLSDWSGDTVDEWDLVLKAVCGGDELLKKETLYLGKDKTVERLTIVGVGKKNFTQYIENILSKAIQMKWPVTAPDKDLRKIETKGRIHE